MVTIVSVLLLVVAAVTAFFVYNGQTDPVFGFDESAPALTAPIIKAAGVQQLETDYTQLQSETLDAPVADQVPIEEVVESVEKLPPQAEQAAGFSVINYVNGGDAED